MPDPFLILGIKGSHVVAGLIGGIARAILRPRIGLWGSIGAALVGMFASAYLTPIVVYLGWRWGFMPAEYEMALKFEHAAAFAVGLTGMTLCEGIILLGQRWRDAPSVPTKP